MSRFKTLLALTVASFAFTGVVLADEAKPEKKAARCCAKAEAEGKACTHECCAAAAKDGKACEKCGGTNPAAS